MLGAVVLVTAGCADRRSMVYQVHTPTDTSPPAKQSPQVSETDQGPINLARPEVSDTPAPGQPLPNEGRYVFLDWFGSAAERARVQNSAAVLRQSRELSAQLGTDVDAGHRRSTVVIGENARLVPTYEDGLPEPDGVEPALRPADITGSVTPALERREEAVAPPAASEPRRDGFAELEARLNEARRKLKQPRTRTAETHTQAPSEPSAPTLPDASNPLLMQIEPGRHGFNSSELATLEKLAGQQARSGRTLHIRAVSRGPAGDSRASLERVRRLNGHTRTAIAALRHYGVDPRDVETSSAEQRVAGNAPDAEALADRDRLEFSFR